ncbi:MAG: hypothetical protein GY861_22430 [bacterium]|nr:hypothetical protein [bacterium]
MVRRILVVFTTMFVLIGCAPTLPEPEYYERSFWLYERGSSRIVELTDEQVVQLKEMFGVGNDLELAKFLKEAAYEIEKKHGIMELDELRKDDLIDKTFGEDE